MADELILSITEQLQEKVYALRKELAMRRYMHGSTRKRNTAKRWACCVRLKP